MTTLLVAKQILMAIYSKYEVYITPLLKFLLALVTLLMINSRLGYMESIDRLTVVLIVALMCSFMPANFIVVAAALFTMLQIQFRDCGGDWSWIPVDVFAVYQVFS